MERNLKIKPLYKVDGITFEDESSAKTHIRLVEEQLGLRQPFILIYSEPDLNSGCYGFTKINIFKIVNQDDESTTLHPENVRKIVENVLAEKGPKYVGIRNSLSLFRTYRVETKLAKDFDTNLSFVTYIENGEVIDCDQFEGDLNKAMQYLRKILINV